MDVDMDAALCGEYAKAVRRSGSHTAAAAVLLILGSGMAGQGNIMLQWAGFK